MPPKYVTVFDCKNKINEIRNEETISQQVPSADAQANCGKITQACQIFFPSIFLLLECRYY